MHFETFKSTVRSSECTDSTEWQSRHALSGRGSCGGLSSDGAANIGMHSAVQDVQCGAAPA